MNFIHHTLMSRKSDAFCTPSIFYIIIHFFASSARHKPSPFLPISSSLKLFGYTCLQASLYSLSNAQKVFSCFFYPRAFFTQATFQSISRSCHMSSSLPLEFMNLDNHFCDACSSSFIYTSYMIPHGLPEHGLFRLRLERFFFNFC